MLQKYFCFLVFFFSKNKDATFAFFYTCFFFVSLSSLSSKGKAISPQLEGKREMAKEYILFVFFL
jgi:hypothetical protein